MARKKAEIERDWAKAEKELDAVLATIIRSKDFELFEKRLDELVACWAEWNKLLAEAEKKIKEKDWVNDKKLDKERKAFKAYVIAQGNAGATEYQKKIKKVETEFAEKVKQNKEAETKSKKLRGDLTKTMADFNRDNDATAAIADLEKLTDDLSDVMQKNELPKDEVFKYCQKLMKEAGEALEEMEKEQKKQLKVTGEVKKMTYEDIRGDMKLFQAYCSMVKQPAHFDFMKTSDFGKKGNEAIYKKFILTNSVNVAKSLVDEFTEIAESDSPNWSKAPWSSVVGAIDVMLSDSRHVEAFKKKLLEARL